MSEMTLGRMLGTDCRARMEAGGWACGADCLADCPLHDRLGPSPSEPAPAPPAAELSEFEQQEAWSLVSAGLPISAYRANRIMETLDAARARAEAAERRVRELEEVLCGLANACEMPVNRRGVLTLLPAALARARAALAARAEGA